MDATEGAFPLHVPGGEMQRGINQRVYVAVAAMQALMSCPDGSHDIEKLLDKAFKIADAFVTRASKRA